MTPMNLAFVLKCIFEEFIGNLKAIKNSLWSAKVQTDMN